MAVAFKIPDLPIETNMAPIIMALLRRNDGKRRPPSHLAWPCNWPYSGVQSTHSSLQGSSPLHC